MSRMCHVNTPCYQANIVHGLGYQAPVYRVACPVGAMIFMSMDIIFVLIRLLVDSGTYLYINSGQWYLWHVPSTFATVNTHANVFFVFLPGSISKEWCHIVLANCDFDREHLPCLCNVYRPFGQDLGDRKNSSRES